MRLPGFTAEAALQPAAGTYRSQTVQGGSVGGESDLHPADVAFQGCYYGPTSYSDCDLAGFTGVYYGWWSWYLCDNRYCSGGFGLVTGP